ncbi:hypothetical protein C361_06906 [Cryptococcus neoformans Tu259-1]|uniref:Uncharacterized protein n=1 Tax=Cryptococcus neoformans Tu259-1 TaxID=1230072 RepID=A0A854Q4Q8_CRYNE|nr:hypothetical protein C361_06906 [Cryptococcus neoformans var. grubii Tu259-1]
MYFESTMVQSRYKIIGYMRSTIPALYTHVMLYKSTPRAHNSLLLPLPFPPSLPSSPADLRVTYILPHLLLTHILRHGPFSQSGPSYPTWDSGYHPLPLASAITVIREIT